MVGALCMTTTKPLLPPREKKVRSSVGLPPSLWKELEDVAEAANYTRDDVIEEFLKWALAQWKAERHQLTKAVK